MACIAVEALQEILDGKIRTKLYQDGKSTQTGEVIGRQGGSRQMLGKILHFTQIVTQLLLSMLIVHGTRKLR